MIVRTYTRRPRCPNPSYSDGGGGASAFTSTSSSSIVLEDTPFSQDSNASVDPYPFVPPPPPSSAPTVISSQDSFLSSVDSDPYGIDGLEFGDGAAVGKHKKVHKNGKKIKKAVNLGRSVMGMEKMGSSAAMVASTSTLMETQEFGEMMEHVDEVNFALDGLRKGQPARIQRGSLLSLLSICSNLQQRRLLRAQGMAKRIIHAVLDLSFDDSPSLVAASAILYVLASDVEDDHLLDSPSCVQFLIKLLNPPIADTVHDKATTIGSRLLGMPKHSAGTLNILPKRLDSSSTAIMSKVQDILVNSKEIKQPSGEGDGIERPELSSKWIVLLTIEKACTSTVSFEDTSGVARKGGGNFKDKLRELGGLDAIFDVAVSCHSNIEEWLECGVPIVLELKDGLGLQSVLLLLKCLKVMENATFLSKDNQNHLLKVNAKLKKGSTLSCVGLIISAIKTFSGISLLQSSSWSTRNVRPNGICENVDVLLAHSSKAQLKERCRENCDKSFSENLAGCSFIQGTGHDKRPEACQKRQQLSGSKSEHMPAAGCSSQKDADRNARASYNKKTDCLMGGLSLNANISKMSSSKESSQCISININCSKLSRLGSSDGPAHAHGSNVNSIFSRKRSLASEDSKKVFAEDGYDPFAFDGDEFGPSKWEALAKNRKITRNHQSRKRDKELDDKLKHMLTITGDDAPKEETHHGSEDLGTSVVHKSSALLEECLLTAVKVLMNLTNDNPVGCQQIASSGGLDTMASLIISHFPSFDLHSSTNSELEKTIAFSKQADASCCPKKKHLNDHELDFLVAILGLLVNLVEKDSRNRSRLVSAKIPVVKTTQSESIESHRDVIPLLCSIFLANQGAGEPAEVGQLACDEEAALLQGEREAEMMIIEAYSALLLAFLSTERNAREAIAGCLPDDNLKILVPVLERFVEFHLTLNMISPETHTIVSEVIESCRIP